MKAPAYLKLPLLIVTAVLFLTACTHIAPTAKDQFSGTCWNSKFEACMDDLEGTLVFHEGQVYLYNNWHGTHKLLGSYEADGKSAKMVLFKDAKADIVFGIESHEKLKVSMPKVIRGMGPMAYQAADKLPWEFMRRDDPKFLSRVKKVIFDAY